MSSNLPKTFDPPLSLPEWQKIIWVWANEKGWHDPLPTISTQMINTVSELTEAHEEIRNGRKPDEVYFRSNGKPEGFPVELADALIRILHTAEMFGLDMNEIVRLKMRYNETRSRRHGGKTA